MAKSHNTYLTPHPPFSNPYFFSVFSLLIQAEKNERLLSELTFDAPPPVSLPSSRKARCTNDARNYGNHFLTFKP